MAKAFAPISAFPTFGKLRENLYQSDFLDRKKALLTYCNSPSYCNKIKIATSYDQRNLYNLGAYVKSLGKCGRLPVNNNNLIAGQFSKLNLQYVCTVNAGPPPLQPFNPYLPGHSCNNLPVQINPSASTTPFYYANTIDPEGEEFGLTQCGELNFTDYMEFYPPAITYPQSIN